MLYYIILYYIILYYIIYLYPAVFHDSPVKFPLYDYTSLHPQTLFSRFDQIRWLKNVDLPFMLPKNDMYSKVVKESPCQSDPINYTNDPPYCGV